MVVVQPVRVARTQGERSAAMQKRLLDATVSALYERGYGGTTTLEVQQRAGVSRGALLHQFSTRTELIIAAVDHLAHQRLDDFVDRMRREAPENGRTEWAVRVIWSSHEGPLFTAALELWLAARNDSELLAALLPQERVIGQSIRGLAAALFGPSVAESPGFGDALEILFDAMRGAAARSVIRTPSTDERLVKLWVRLIERGLAE
jgi:AcrR family transcriptional regulator